MKFAVFFLIAGFCLIAINAASIQSDEILLDEETPVETVEIRGQTLMIFNKFFWVIWKALRVLKGINCSIKEVIHIKDESLRFPKDLVSCKVELTEPVKKVVDSLNQVVTHCDNILNLNSNVCHRENPNGDENMMDEYQEIDGQTFSFFKCTFKLLKEFDALEHQIVSTVKLMKALPDAAFNVGGCMCDKTESLVKLFTDFPVTIKTCSKLN